jgi:4-hydroxythreonine-4-phosphate dehydrogenase
MENTHKPLIGFTLGDFNGIGPELILKTLTDGQIAKICTPIIYGSAKILTKYKKLIPCEEHQYHFIKDASQAQPKKLNLINCWDEDYEIEPGKETAIAGKCAFKSLEMATADLKKGFIDAMVTAPINKHNIQNENFKFVGHTEYIQAQFAAPEVLMFLVSDRIKVAIVSQHVPITGIINDITPEKITAKLNLIITSLKKDFSKPKPRIAVLGLNPHAGDNGAIGKEDQEIILPVIKQFREKGELVYGPYPADGFFAAAKYTKYDAVLAMYHDQGLIPFKMIAFDEGVNFTAGLSAVRTSPDHGTAYDIAGKNKADESSFRHAIFVAIDVLNNRKNSI